MRIEVDTCLEWRERRQIKTCPHEEFNLSWEIANKLLIFIEHIVHCSCQNQPHSLTLFAKPMAKPICSIIYDESLKLQTFYGLFWYQKCFRFISFDYLNISRWCFSNNCMNDMCKLENRFHQFSFNWIWFDEEEKF